MLEFVVNVKKPLVLKYCQNALSECFVLNLHSRSKLAYEACIIAVFCQRETLKGAFDSVLVRNPESSRRRDVHI